MTDYTPTTDEVRGRYVGEDPNTTYWPNDYFEKVMKHEGGYTAFYGAEFDRWFAPYKKAFETMERQMSATELYTPSIEDIRMRYSAGHVGLLPEIDRALAQFAEQILADAEERVLSLIRPSDREMSGFLTGFCPLLRTDDVLNALRGTRSVSDD